MKTILVTGASGGIGKEITAALKQSGNRVIAINRTDADLALFADIKKLQKKILTNVEQIDWIVCAHGFIDTETDWEKQSPEAIAKIFSVNSLSLFYIAQLFLKHLSSRGGMVVISSTAGLRPNGRIATYSASKAAANAFVQALAQGHPKHTFVSICPGPTNTAMRERIAGDSVKMQSPAVVAKVVTELIVGEKGHKSGDIIVVRDGKTRTVERLK